MNNKGIKKAYEMTAEFSLPSGEVKNLTTTLGGDSIEEATLAMYNTIKVLYGEVQAPRIKQYRLIGDYTTWFKRRMTENA